MLVKNDVRCNWCDWEGCEDDLDLIVDLSDGKRKSRTKSACKRGDLSK